ncbi:MAG TPA: hypothetical protein VL027_08005 [Spongiibacteraceae bacterium]|jgi:hypothetical protein|nr:hypothetical protein [Spongiibacteraceae bacterium]HUH37872.1 hypothetical protein [Spongiibacteraceae bacterium]
MTETTADQDNATTSGAQVDDLTRIEVYLDDGETPIVTHRPPARFELDTTRLSDGPHELHIRAFDASGQQGLRSIPFIVRNGPGIAVNGLKNNDVLEGKHPILVNAYGGSGEHYWEPSRVETPAPIPTWIWVLLIVITAFAAFYGVEQWHPPAGLYDTPPALIAPLGGGADDA